MSTDKSMAHIVGSIIVTVFLISTGVTGDTSAYHGTIPENAAEGDVVNLDKSILVRNHSAAAHDKICGYTVYKSHSDLPFRTVLLDPTTGSAIIVVTSETQIDFEKQRQYNFEISAHDCVSGAHLQREKVIIDVLDVNDHSPEWKTNLVSVEVEEKRIYGRIIRLKATDQDATEAFSRICQYRVVTPDSPFVVDNNGYMSNTEPLEYVKQSNYVVEVIADDCAGLNSTSKFVHVKVTSTCRPHWADFQDNVEFVAGSNGQKAIMPNARVDLCGLTSCNLTALTATVKLTPANDETTCERDADSVKNQRKYCGAVDDIVYILPDTTDYKPMSKAQIDVGVQSFDGKTNAYDVPSSKLNYPFGKHFMLSTWMKHGEVEDEFVSAGGKEQILCLADGEAMNRHHMSLAIHNCRLVLLIRQESYETTDAGRFQPAEWRWKIAQACDSEWHHYTINVDYPDVKLFIDGELFVDDERNNPELIDDWPLHPTRKVHSTKLVVGACWQGRNHRFGEFFRGELLGLSVAHNKTDSVDVIHCLNSCRERLDFPSLDELEHGTSISQNEAKTTVVVTGGTPQAVQSQLRRLNYVNTRTVPTLSKRPISLETLAICSNGAQHSLEKATIDIAVVKEIDIPTVITQVDISSSPLVLTDSEHLARGAKLFADLVIHLKIKTSNEKDEAIDVDLTRSDKFQSINKNLESCTIRTKTHMNLSVEHLKYPENLVHDLGFRVGLTEDGMTISGTKTSSEFEEVLHNIKFVNADVKNFTKRSFSVVCATESDRFVGSKVDVTVELTHVQPTILSAAVIENKMIHQEVNKLYIEKVARSDVKPAKSKPIGTGVAVAILACIGLMVVMTGAGVMRMRRMAKDQTGRGVNIEDKQEMEWDNSALTITVNPMDQEMMNEDLSSGVDLHGDETDTEDEASVHEIDAEEEGEADDIKKAKTRELEWDDSTLTY